MILADTSVWIDYLNGQITPQTDLLDDCLVEGTLAMGDLIFLEILQGVKDEKQFKKVKTKLSLLDQYSMFGSDMIFKCANNYRTLRKKGITIRKTNDVIIASFCIERKMGLLYFDRDFKPFSEFLGLKSAY
ncbi:PIN domain nuclease [Endozoicomonas sp. ONNA1]|uniref:type II toxin-antitoxin system VapC family toxin n=1 Tax=unclassified Endozoicomonas TaxID=2644528 RepID=UPI00214768C6